MKRFALILIFLSSFGSGLKAQEFLSLPVRIDTVLIFGNKKTHDTVILREIPFQFPDTLDVEKLQYIQQRLLNLALFSRINFAVVSQDRKNYLLIEVQEYWYIFPIPLIFINERDWSKWSYGLQLTHFNFRGRNEKLTIGGWLGYNPTFYLDYFNPWMGKTSRLILGFSFFTKRIANKFFDFDEQHLGGKLTFGKRLSLDFSLQSFFDLRRVKMPLVEVPGVGMERFTVSGRESDLVPKLGLQLRWDRRDLIEYPLQGYYLDWTISRTGFTEKQPRFWRFQLDNRVYFHLYRSLYLGSRNFTILNRGNLPIYDRIFIGYQERIRGYFSRVFSRQNLMLQTVELRLQLLKPRFFSWNNSPLPDFVKSNLKFGMNLALFAETGTLWDHSNELGLKHFFSGFGGGLHFNLPYNTVLRIDYAINDRGKGEWIFDSGVSF